MVDVIIPFKHALAAFCAATAAGEAGCVPDASHSDHLLHLVHRFGADCALGCAVKRHIHDFGGVAHGLGVLLGLHRRFDVA
jgi:hypothetical protein